MKLPAFDHQPLRMAKMTGGKILGRLCTVSEKLSYCKLNDLYIILTEVKAEQHLRKN